MICLVFIYCEVNLGFLERFIVRLIKIFLWGGWIFCWICVIDGEGFFKVKLSLDYRENVI